MSMHLVYAGLVVCDCGAPYCRECGDHCQRAENIGLPGWHVAGWLCGCGWAISDPWADHEGPSSGLH